MSHPHVRRTAREAWLACASRGLRGAPKEANRDNNDNDNDRYHDLFRVHYGLRVWTGRSISYKVHKPSTPLQGTGTITPSVHWQPRCLSI